MFKEISWDSYWTFIALTVILYYLLLLVVHRIKGGLLLPGGTKRIWHKQEQASQPSSGALPFEPTQHADPDFLSPKPGSDEYAVYACVDEVNAYLDEARSRKSDKEAITIALKQIVSKYPSIKETEYKASLTSVMVAQCAHLCFVTLTDADIDKLWRR